MKMDLIDLLDEFESGAGGARKNPPEVSTADYLSFVQGKGVDLQARSEEEWSDVADAMDLDDLEREDFLEEVAGWL